MGRGLDMNQRKRRKRRAAPGGSGNGFVTVCIAAAGLIALFKRIPLTNRIGDSGNAYFGIAYDTYMFFFLFCGYSVQSVIARMVAARCSKGQYRNTRRVWKVLLAATAVLSLVAAGLMLLLAGTLAGGLLNTGIGATAVQCMAPALVFSSLAGLYRGYFQGMGTMVPTALSRFLEEAVSLGCMLLFAGMLGGRGQEVAGLLRNPEYEQAFGAAGGMLGMVAGGAAAFVFLLVVYAMFQGSFRKKERKDVGKGTESYRRIARIGLVSSLPVILSGFALHGSYILDQILFLRLMPVTVSTVTEWGIYTGKYRILTTIPAVMVTAVCSSMIPLLAVSNASMNMGRLRERSQLLLRLSLILSLPIAVYMAVTADCLVPALFSVGDTETVASLLRVGSVSIVLQAMGIALASVLQGMERERNLLINAGASLLIHAVVLYVFLTKQNLGIRGVVGSVIVLYAVYLVLNLTAVLRLVSVRADWGRIIGIPVIASAISGGLVFAIKSLLNGKAADGAICVLGFLIGGILYLVLILALHGVSERDLKEVPGGGAVIFLGKALHLM